jgi:hypothetical protein
MSAEEAYAPTATPISRTKSNVYTGIGFFSWSILIVPFLLKLASALAGRISAAISGQTANGFRILLRVWTKANRFALRTILIISSDK